MQIIPALFVDGVISKKGNVVAKASISRNYRFPTLSWRDWTFLYKWCYYSERYTMSSNDVTLTGKLPPYFMSNITLEKGLSFKWADISLKGIVNNLFDEEYLSVLSRPMPGINFEIFVGITPKF